MAAGCMLVTGNEKFYRQCVMPTVRLLDAETAHVFAVRLAKYGIVPLMNRDDSPSLVSKFGLIDSIGTYIFSGWNFMDNPLYFDRAWQNIRSINLDIFCAQTHKESHNCNSNLDR